LSDGSKVPALTFYYITKSIIKDTAKVKEFVVKQKSENIFLVEYVAKDDLTTEEKEAIRAAFKQYVSAGLEITIDRKNEIKRTKSGKLKQFERLF
jgi:phenylacetate-CoA ligase